MASKTTTVRISEASKQALKEIAERTGVSQAAALDRAIEEFKKKVIMDSINESFARLRADEKASKEYDEEFKLWETGF